MKKIQLLLLFLSFVTLSGCGKKPQEASVGEPAETTPVTDYAKSIQGAWVSYDVTKSGERLTKTTIVMDGYMAEAIFNADQNKFIKCFGGSWSVDKNVFSLTTEFSSDDPSQVGTTSDVVFYITSDTIAFEGDNSLWTRVDSGQQGDLAGAWLITGREQEGKMNHWEPGPRKTMKILSDKRFQWIAFNTETKEFFGTGGGTYEAANGTYTENIEFFSRDSSRVGASLRFDFQLQEGKWHHSGSSSKGDPIHEVWTRRKDLEK